MSHPFSAFEVARIFMHGLPKSIVTDGDKLFLSYFWKELFKVLQVQLLYSSVYHSQTDGQTEWLNRCLENYLRCMTGHKLNDWNKWISRIWVQQQLSQVPQNRSFYSGIWL